MKTVFVFLSFLIAGSAMASQSEVRIRQQDYFTIIYVKGSAAVELYNSLNTPVLNNAEVQQFKRGKSLSCTLVSDEGPICSIALKANGKDGEVTDFPIGL